MGSFRLNDGHFSLSVDDIQVQISNERVSLDFLLPAGLQSQTFIQDVQRASDSARNMVSGSWFDSCGCGGVSLRARLPAFCSVGMMVVAWPYPQVTVGNPRWNWLEKHVNRIENRTGLNVHRMAPGRPGEPIGDGDDVSLDTFMSTTSCPSTLTPDADEDGLSLGTERQPGWASSFPPFSGYP